MMIVVKVILVGLYMKDLWYCVYVFIFILCVFIIILDVSWLVFLYGKMIDLD